MSEMTDCNNYCAGLKPSRKIKPTGAAPFSLLSSDCERNTNERLSDGIAI